MVLHNHVPHAQASLKEASGEHIKPEACMQVLHPTYNSWCPLTCLVANLLPSHLQPGRLRIALLRSSMGAHARLPPLRRGVALAQSREGARVAREPNRGRPYPKALPRAALREQGLPAPDVWWELCLLQSGQPVDTHARNKRAGSAFRGAGRKCDFPSGGLQPRGSLHKQKWAVKAYQAWGPTGCMHMCCNSARHSICTCSQWLPILNSTESALHHTQACTGSTHAHPSPTKHASVYAPSFVVHAKPKFPHAVTLCSTQLHWQAPTLGVHAFLTPRQLFRLWFLDFGCPACGEGLRATFGHEPVNPGPFGAGFVCALAVP